MIILFTFLDKNATICERKNKKGDKMELKEILTHVDHTLLKQESTWGQIKAICDDGIKFNTASVCIPPSYVKECAEYCLQSF